MAMSVIAQQIEKEKTSRWPYYIVGFFVVIFAMNAALIYFAYSSFSGLAVKDYYQKSYFYDAQRSAAKTLGWSVAMDIKTPLELNKDLPVFFSVLDKGGAPIRGAAVFVTVRRLTTDRFDTRYELKETGAGYAGVLRLSGAGRWEIFVEAQKQGRQVEKRFKVRL